MLQDKLFNNDPTLIVDEMMAIILGGVASFASAF
jgi:hypothetical protein